MPKTPNLPIPTSPFSNDQRSDHNAALPTPQDGLDWRLLSLVLVTPDCIERGLQEQALDKLRENVFLSCITNIIATEEQIMRHFSNLLSHEASLSWPGVDIASELKRLYVGREVCIGIAFACGEMFDGPDAPDTATLVQHLIGHEDPAQADPSTVRGKLGRDSIATALHQRRLVESVIHSSASPAAAAREFGIWLEPLGMNVQTWTAP
ncbi:nucleoside-diphosphate kinase [Kineosporia babensis]|uniref:Nucleoside diphosphate kinase-like domain-containing protein n=1 Tax=Kineosporia babensis TaxID=499548 RepID=A0A9X1NP23_9ACTN|nr:nucleoside-diphosphate kinase [Kineosporia babensis]MCD5316671.1 hypothetical protein [Kineosporia babensis]